MNGLNFSYKPDLGKWAIPFPGSRRPDHILKVCFYVRKGGRFSWKEMYTYINNLVAGSDVRLDLMDTRAFALFFFLFLSF